MKLNPRNSSFISHFAWYFSGALVPMLINFIKTPILTRHYTPEDFGVLGLVMISFGYLATLSFSWIRSCLWRFYPKYKLENKLKILYSNLLFIYILSAVVLGILGIIAQQFFEPSALVYKLIVVATLHCILHELLGLYFVIMRLKGNAKEYNLLVSLQVILSFILLLFLVFIADFDISAMLWCYVFIDILFIIFFAAKTMVTSIPITFSWQCIKKRELKRLFNFGGINLLASVFLMLIVTSDRYIIALFEPMDQVGIYSKTYDVAQMSILALVFVFFNAVNPSMNKILEENPKAAKNILYKYIYAFTFLALPVVSLASIFKKEISEILLGEAFQSGYILMPYIFFSMLLFGIINFYENEYKFSDRLLQMTLFFGIGFIINITLNFILIPEFGMIWAAVSTLFSYVVILLLFLMYDEQIKDLLKIGSSKFIFMIVLLVTLTLMDCVLRNYIEFGLVEGIIEAILFIAIVVSLFWKDIKNLEIPMLH